MYVSFKSIENNIGLQINTPVLNCTHITLEVEILLNISWRARMSEVSSAGRLGFRAPPVVGGAEGVAELERVRGTDALGSVDSDISVIFQ